MSQKLSTKPIRADVIYLFTAGFAFVIGSITWFYSLTVPIGVIVVLLITSGAGTAISIYSLQATLRHRKRLE